MLINTIKFFIDPFNIFWILLVLALVSWLLKKRPLLKWLVISSSVWFLIISTPMVPTLLINSLEDRYEPITIDQLPNRDAEYHIIILGGGHGFDDRLPPNSLLSSNALGRLTEGIRLHRQLPNSRLVFSGSTSTPGRTTQAEMLYQSALLLGINKESAIIQNEPRNTFEEAKIYAENYGNSHPTIVVASASQMPRAVEAFRLFGIDPFPSPANYKLKGSWKHKWLGLPAMNNIENMKTGIYEYAGLFWYSFKN